MRPSDTVRTAIVPLRARPMRSVLSAIGIAIGVAAIVAVVSAANESSADLIQRLDRYAGMLVVTPAQISVQNTVSLPDTSVAMVRRIAPVLSVSATARVDGTVRRSDRVPAGDTSGIVLRAARVDLLASVQGGMRDGRFLTDATEAYPCVVLGATSAQRLGISRASLPSRVYVDGRWLLVVGVLQPVAAAPELDTSALLGFAEARQLTGQSVPPDTEYVRTFPERLDEVRGVLPEVVNPIHPELVSVDRPSVALALRTATESTFSNLVLGLGAVAVVAGGVGVANVMLVSVLERRGEIGVRRAMGARRLHVGLQFLVEALVLAAVGAIIGLLCGMAAAVAYAASNGLPLEISFASIGIGTGASLIVGAAAGAYPAWRAASLAPTEALRSF